MADAPDTRFRPAVETAFAGANYFGFTDPGCCCLIFPQQIQLRASAWAVAESAPARDPEYFANEQFTIILHELTHFALAPSFTPGLAPAISHEGIYALWGVITSYLVLALDIDSMLEGVEMITGRAVPSCP